MNNQTENEQFCPKCGSEATIYMSRGWGIKQCQECGAVIKLFREEDLMKGREN